jgi:catalase (peroxidase I)
MQAGHEIQTQQNQTGAAEGVDHARDGVGELVGDLDPVAVEKAASDDGVAVEVGNVVGGEDAREQVADYAA